MTRESEIEKYLVRRAKELGGEVRKVQWIGRRGAPDRLVMTPLRFVPGSHPDIERLAGGSLWIELKAPGEKTKPHQAREHERMRAMGQRVEVVDSFERVDEVLQ